MTPHPMPQTSFSLLRWEVIEKTVQRGRGELFLNIIRRAQVPGGWLVHTVRELSRSAESGPSSEAGAEAPSIAIGVGEGAGMAFVPDAAHAWILEAREPKDSVLAGRPRPARNPAPMAG